MALAVASTGIGQADGKAMLIVRPFARQAVRAPVPAFGPKSSVAECPPGRCGMPLRASNYNAKFDQTLFDNETG